MLGNKNTQLEQMNRLNRGRSTRDPVLAPPTNEPIGPLTTAVMQGRAGAVRNRNVSLAREVRPPSVRSPFWVWTKNQHFSGGQHDAPDGDRVVVAHARPATVAHRQFRFAKYTPTLLHSYTRALDCPATVVWWEGEAFLQTHYENTSNHVPALPTGERFVPRFGYHHALKLELPNAECSSIIGDRGSMLRQSGSLSRKQDSIQQCVKCPETFREENCSVS